MTTRKEELQSQIKKLKTELNKITDAEDAASDAAYVGRCFRMRNSFSSGNGNSWWIYTRVLKANDGLHCITFQIDYTGRIEIRPTWHMMSESLDSYEPISVAAFMKAWDRCVHAVTHVSLV